MTESKTSARNMARVGILAIKLRKIYDTAPADKLVALTLNANDLAKIIGALEFVANNCVQDGIK